MNLRGNSDVRISRTCRKPGLDPRLASGNMEIRLTGISQDSKEATITLWHVKEGERVAEGQDLVEVATDKAAFDVPAPCDGVLTGIKKRAGDTARTDEVIAIIREDKSWGA